jgi:hypothetical protein
LRYELAEGLDEYTYPLSLIAAKYPNRKRRLV